MADILSQIQQRQAAAQEQQLAQADTNNTWAQTFNSVPAVDKVFAAQDLNDMIARVTAQKQAAIEASDPKIALAHARTQEVLDRTQHSNDMAPLSVQFKRSQFEAQKALEARRLKEDALANTVKAHEDNFFADRAAFQADHPSATQEELDANDISLRDRYPHIRKSKGADEILSLAERNSLARQTEVRKVDSIRQQNERLAAEAPAAGLVKKGTAASGLDLYGKPAAQQTLEERAKERFELSKASASGTGTGHLQDKLNEELVNIAKFEESARRLGTNNPAKLEEYNAAIAGAKAAANLYKTQIEAARAPAAPAAAAVKQAQTPQEWLALNPDDPRAAAIRAKLGIK